MSTTLDTLLRGVVGARTASVLEKELGLVTVGDLLTHYPRRYDERGELTELASLRVGDDVTVLAEVASVRRRPMRARNGTILEVTVTDGRARLELTWFNQAWRERELRVGRRAFFAGQVKEFRGKRQLTNPDYELLDADPGPDAEGLDAGALPFAGALLPVYRATAKCASWVVRRSVEQALRVLDPPDDPLPAALRGRRRWPGLYDALRGVHAPADRAELARARERLTFDEAYLLQVALAQRRADAGRWRAHPRPGRPDGIAAAFDARLPFALTAGQREVGEVLARELGADAPMHRLLQGEVGSGKTVCALRAMLQVVDSPAGTGPTGQSVARQGQAALLAPTEVLATQHARALSAMLGDLALAGELGAAEQATRVVLLTGSQGAAARREAHEAVRSGAAGIVVGTHALLSEPVGFADLGLVVVDEQHRFGVEQRDALRAKAGEAPPHVLVMTATPIPRTVAMTVYGDLEVSSLTELPAGRSPITTHVVPGTNPRYVARTWERVREEVEGGHQAFVVCPRIGDAPGPGEPEADEPADDPGGDGESEGRRPAVAVLDVLPLLRDDLLAGLRVEVLHGRLPVEEKDDVMRRVVAGEVDVLLATTVVEVGVDVPNATAMVVLDADRFGVSQLHQLRGRVGRGSAPSVCLLVSEAEPGTPAHERLAAVAATTDGAQLARLDLSQRREGDVLGATQSGRRRTLKLLELLRHEELITEARREATRLVEVDPELTSSPALAAALRRSLDEESAAYLEKA